MLVPRHASAPVGGCGRSLGICVRAQVLPPPGGRVCSLLSRDTAQVGSLRAGEWRGPRTTPITQHPLGLALWSHLTPVTEGALDSAQSQAPGRSEWKAET